MDSGWRTLHLAVMRIRWKSDLSAARGFRGFKRVDVALAMIVVALLLSVGSVGFGVVLGHQKFGWFDDTPFASVEDRRLLTNFRNHENAGPFVDMAADSKAEALFVVRRDGVVHRLHVPTRVWSDELIRTDTNAVQTDIVALDSECGSVTPPATDCQSGRLWALSASGGLVVRESSGWRSVMSDIAWIGLSGTPVSHEELRTVAVSDDLRWILLGTESQGVGLFDNQGSQWTPLDDANQRVVLKSSATNGLATAVSRALWSKDRFWIGGPAGLAWIDPSAARPMMVREESVRGAVLDMDLEPSGDFLVLSQGECRDAGQDCFAVQRVERVGAAPVIISESERHLDLSGGSVQHAAIQGNRALTFGSAGVHRYDVSSRGWRGLDEGPVTAVLETASEQVVYAATPGNVSRYANGLTENRWSIPDQKLVNLQFSPDGDVLAFAENESLYKLTSTGSVEELRRRTVSQLDISTARAAGRMENTLVLAGNVGVLRYDVRTRRYETTSPSHSPAALLASETKVFSPGGKAMWAKTDARAVARLTVGRDANGTFVWDEQSHTFQSAIERFQPDPKGAFVTFDGGGPSRLEMTSAGLVETALTGAPRLKGMRTLVSARAFRNLVYFADQQALWSYNFRERGWKGPFNTGLEKQALKDFTATDEALYTVGARGQLVRFQANQQQTLLGHGPVFPFGSGQLEDAMVDSRRRLHLAGAGRIVAYNAADRVIEDEWAPPGTGALNYSGAFSGVPVGRRGETAFFGKLDLTLPGAKVHSVSVKGNEIVTVQERHGEKFLAVFPAIPPPTISDARCYFGAEAPPDARIRDAVELTDGRLAVLSGDRVALYEPSNRRWRQTDWTVPSDTERLLLLGDWLAAAGNGGLAVAKASELQAPGSCSDSKVKIFATRHRADQVAVESNFGQALLLSEDGALRRWRDGRIETDLPASSAGPNPDDLIRVYLDSSRAMVLSRQAAWWYDPQTRQWSQTAFSGLDGARVVTADALRIAEGRFAVTVWTEDGRSYGGVANSSQVNLPLTEMRGLILPQVPWDFGKLVDAAEWKGRWLFLFPDRLAILRPGYSSWEANLVLPEVRGDRRLALLDGLLTLEEGASEAPSSIFLFPNPPKAAAVGRMIEHSMRIDPLTLREFGVVRADDPEARSIMLIDRTGVARRCKIAPGHLDPATCEAMNLAPLPFSKEGLLSAYALGPKILVLRTGGAALLDRGARRLDSLAPSLSGLDLSAVRVFEVDNALWLLFAEEELWRIGENGSVRRIASDIVALYEEVGKAQGMWLAFSDGRLRLASSAGEVLSIEKTMDLLGDTTLQFVGLTGLSIDNVGITAITHGGLIMSVGRADGVSTDDLLLLSNSPKLENSLAVLPDVVSIEKEARLGYWLQDGSRMRFLHRDRCSATLGPLIEYTEVEIHQGEKQEEDQILDLEDSPPKTIACVTTAIDIDLASAAETPLQVVRTIDFRSSDSFDLLTDTGRYVVRGGVVTYLQSETGALLSPDRATDQSERLLRDITELSSNDERLDVPVMKQVAGEVHLSLGPDQQVFSSGSISSVELPPLDSNWLTWRRAERLFDVGVDPDRILLSPEAFVDGGHFLSDVPGRFYQLTEETFVGVNSHGHWNYGPKSTNIARELRYTPAALSNILGVAHGRLLFKDNSRPVIGGATEADTNSTAIALGELRLSDDWRGQSVEAEMLVGGRLVNAFAERGFAFDKRRSVGWWGSNAVLMTDLGVSMVDRLSIIAPIPDPARQTRLQSIEGNLYAHTDDDRWFTLVSSAWVASVDPTQSWNMVRTGRRTWLRENGRTRIEAVPAGADWKARTLSKGGFVADRLLSAVVNGTGLLVNTAAGTHVLPTSQSLMSMNAAPLPPPPDPSQMAVRFHKGNGFIFAGSGASERHWDAGKMTWQTIQGDGFRQNRDAASVSGLTVSLRDGKWRAAVEMSSIDSDARAATTFEWQAGGYFPFDTATAVYGLSNGVVAVGTQFGLRTLGGSREERLNISPGIGSTPPSIDRIGRPLDTPEQVIARGGGYCAIFDGVSWARCEDPDRLDRRFLGGSPYWRWSWDKRVEGRYLDRAGIPFGPPIEVLSSTRFPHDSPRDLMACNGESFAVRSDGLIEHYQNESGNPKSSIGLWKMPERGIGGRLNCLRSTIHLAGEDLVPGVFLISRRAVHRLDSGEWRNLGDEHAGAIRALDRGSLLPDWGRLRARRAEGGGWQIERRTLGNKWEVLNWDKGRLDADVFLGPATAAHERYWAATPAGLVSYRLRNHLEIVPGDFTIVVPTEDGQEPCRIERIETLDGRSKHASQTASSPTRLRCVDGRVFRGVLDGSAEKGVFAPIEEDPFLLRNAVLQLQAGEEEQQLVWQIRTPARGVASLSVFFKDEEIPLTAGRLGIDDLKGLAVFEKGLVEQVSSIGWLRTNSNLSAHVLERLPTDDVRADEVVALSITRERVDGPASLCLERRDGSSVEIATDWSRRQDRRCATFLGHDGLWTYRLAANRVEVIASARNGPILKRTLVEGRFSDLWAEGLPVRFATDRDAELYVPTKAGVSIFDSLGLPKGVLAVEGRTGGLSATQGSPFFLRKSNVTALSGGSTVICPELLEHVNKTPADMKILRIESLEGGAWELRLEVAGERMQVRFLCTSASEGFMPWIISTSVGHRPRFQANAADWPNAGAGLFAWLMDTSLMLHDGKGNEASLATEMDGSARRLVIVSGVLFLLTEEELYSGEIDALVSYLHKHGRIPLQDASTTARTGAPSVRALSNQELNERSARIDLQGAIDQILGPGGESVQRVREPNYRERVFVQRALKKLGYYRGETDGIFGPLSRDAIRRYQLDRVTVRAEP